MRYLLIPLFFLASTAIHAWTFKSGEQQVGVLELYTSEGCSSCPPADRFVSTLKDEDGLWDEFIPIAFHVDYWDYIGWKDKFASAQYSNRQRQYAREQSLKSVYTPGFVYNGKEWRGWFLRRFIDLPDGGEPGVLELELVDDVAMTRFSPPVANYDKLAANVAILGFDLSSRVSAGENRGRQLAHDFIVLGITSKPMALSQGRYLADIKIPEPAVRAARYAVVSWVSDGRRQAPLQATGGWLKSSIE